MIQILKLRSFVPNGEEKEVFYAKEFSPLIRAESVGSLLGNVRSFVDQIPESERWNCFYTVSQCTDETREFQGVENILFDLDGINVTPTQGGKYPFAEAEQYISIVTGVIGVKAEDVAIIFSGNGLHFLGLMREAINDPLFFRKNRHHYKMVAAQVKAALEKAGLPGKIDPVVFEPRRIIRLPRTLNRKPERPERLAEIINASMTSLDWPLKLKQLSGLPDVVVDTGFMSQRESKNFPKVDSEAVLSGCGFIKWTQEHPTEVHYPQYLALLTLIGRMDNGFELAKKYSERFDTPSINRAPLEAVYEQAITNMGPRTCSGVQDIWDGCSQCPHFGRVRTPLQIKGAGFIATENVSFCLTGPRGGLAPIYEDLRKFFEKENPYKVLDDSKVCFVFNGKYWEHWADEKINGFAERAFQPHPTENKWMYEFLGKVHRTNQVKAIWFGESSHRRVNFNNGYLDIDTQEFHPHSPDVGFQYCLPYDYNPNSDCPNFRKFLSEVTGGDEALQELLVEYAGYALSNDDCWTGKCLILLGDGNNGKSTWMDILRAVAGDESGKENFSNLTLTAMKVDTNCYQMEGKLFNMAEETPSHALFDSSFFKNAVTGGYIPIKQLYKQPYSIRNRTKFIFACNDLPKTEDTSKGMNRCPLIAPFSQDFTGCEDPFLRDKLKAELPGIFNLFLRGYQELRRRGKFTDAQSAKDALSDYKYSNNIVAQWLEEHVEFLPIPSDKISYTEPMYSVFKAFSESRGEKVMPYQSFAQKLTTLIPDVKTREYRATTGKKAAWVLWTRSL